MSILFFATILWWNKAVQRNLLAGYYAFITRSAHFCPSFCPVDRQQQRRSAGLLLSSGAGSRYRSIAAVAARYTGRVNLWSNPNILAYFTEVESPLVTSTSSGLTSRIHRTVYRYFSAYAFIYFSVFLFSTFQFLVLCGRLSWLISLSAFECTLNRRLVSYRVVTLLDPSVICCR